MHQNYEAVLHFCVTPCFCKAEKQVIDATDNIQKSVIRNCGMWAEKQWRGKILSHDKVYHRAMVESLEEGYEDCEDDVWLEQIIRIEDRSHTSSSYNKASKLEQETRQDSPLLCFRQLNI